MKLLIQLTFNNGLGNLYCGAVEVLHFVDFYKQKGYDCELLFASNGNMGSNKFINYVEFEEIFDVESFSVFDKITNIEHSTRDKNYDGYTYHSTQYGPDFPGAHWWDVFFDEIPEEPIHPKFAYNMETLMRKESIPKFLPKLNKKIYEKVDLFLDENNEFTKSIQIRYNDYQLNPSDDFKLFCEKTYEKLNSIDETFYVTTHNKYATDILNKLDNTIMYNYNNIDDLPNDHGYYFYHKNFDREILLERLYDNLTEMVLLSKCDIIYFYTSISWTSTFLYYSLSNNQKQKLININNNIENIV